MASKIKSATKEDVEVAVSRLSLNQKRSGCMILSYNTLLSPFLEHLLRSLLKKTALFLNHAMKINSSIPPYIMYYELLLDRALWL